MAYPEAIWRAIFPSVTNPLSGGPKKLRIITTPKAAKVYQLIGFTPDVRVENLPLDTGYELLVYLQGYVLQTRRVEPASQGIVRASVEPAPAPTATSEATHQLQR